MKTTTAAAVLTALCLSTVNAAPNPLLASIRSLFTKTGGLLTFGDLGSTVLFDGAQKIVENVLHEVQHVEEEVETWVEDGATFVQEAGVTYEQVKLNALEEHSLRFKKPKLCDTSVKQYSGYLDVTNGKHLFFWFFEARKNPEKAPLLLWLNGGPGCSSSTGLLFELGPCSIAKDDSGKPYTKPNPHSWTEYANVIFLDQPVNVGFSYSNDSSTVVTSPAAAQDVWAFLELFLARFPEYDGLDFHVAAESYGGTYAPNIVSVISSKNKEIASSSSVKDTELKEINLKSVILANGITEPYTQFGTIPEFLCDGPFPVLDNDGPECANLRSKVPTCQRLVKGCYNSGSRLACVPAGLYCSSQLWAPLQQLGLNPYDVRKKCNKDEDGSLCYRQMEWIDEWMNLPEIQADLGTVKGRKFESCNMQVNQAFFFQGDGMHNSAALLSPLLTDGLKLLVYAGNADGMCNFIGNLEWMKVLEDHPYVDEFRNATTQPWITHNTGKVAGFVRSAGSIEANTGRVGSGAYTYVSISDAGHMVPYDQPEAALDLFSRWVADKPLTS